MREKNRRRYFGETQNTTNDRLSNHSVLCHKAWRRLERNVKEEANLKFAMKSRNTEYLQIAVQTAHNLTSQHQMIIMDPDKVLRAAVSSCVDPELVVDSHVGTPVLSENL